VSRSAAAMGGSPRRTCPTVGRIEAGRIALSHLLGARPLPASPRPHRTLEPPGAQILSLSVKSVMLWTLGLRVVEQDRLRDEANAGHWPLHGVRGCRACGAPRFVKQARHPGPEAIFRWRPGPQRRSSPGPGCWKSPTRLSLRELPAALGVDFSSRGFFSITLKLQVTPWRN